MNRSDLVEKINTAKHALLSAGCIHRHDLNKHIKRMERELRDYDRYQKEARKAAG